MFLENPENSHWSTCTGVSFLVKVACRKNSNVVLLSPQNWIEWPANLLFFDKVGSVLQVFKILLVSYFPLAFIIIFVFLTLARSKRTLII